MIANGSKTRKKKKTKNHMNQKYIPEYLEEIVKLLKEIKKELGEKEPKEKKAGRPKKGEIEVRNGLDK